VNGLARRTAVLVAVAAVAVAAVALWPHGSSGYAVSHLVADPGFTAREHDPTLVNAWGLAASPTGPWWTANEARDTSSLYDADGRKQALTVSVEGGPTGVAYVSGSGFPVTAGGRTGPARFVYAAEDGTIRAWSPAVPGGWSKQAEVVVDRAGTAAVFRGVTVATLPNGQQRLYATDFHNDRVDVFDDHWRPVRTAGFRDASIPEWYQPFGIEAIGDRVFVSYAEPAPVNGNDQPTGGYVDEFTLDGKLVSHVDRMGPLAEPWGMALAPKGFGSAAGALLVGNFGSGRIDVYRRHGTGPETAWSFRGQLEDARGKPIAVSGLWALRFGNGGLAGPRTTLFFTAGPHRWYGSSELQVHGLLGSIEPA
jgi:uncharacterized protein (TIGR03118 family)